MNGRRAHRANNRMGRAMDALRALRARQWIHFIGLPAATLDRAALSAPATLLPRALLFMAAASCALAYAYGINAIADRTGDEPTGKNPLAGMTRVPPEIYAAVSLTALLGLVLSLALGLVPFVFMLASIAAGTVYSAGPRLKSKPFLGLFFNTMIFVPLMGLAWPDGGRPAGYATLVLTFTALLIQNQLLHERADEREDARAQNLTTARWLGKRGTRALLILTALAGIGLSRALSPSSALFWASSAALIAGALAALLEPAPARARSLHKWIALLSGLIVFTVSIFP